MRIAVVAPSSRFAEEAAQRVAALPLDPYGRAQINFHPQCFLTHNHFAGTDKERADAFVEVANNPEIDAIWCARGGYGSNRIAEDVVARLEAPARRKYYLGYSDAGFLLAGLYRAGFGRVAHGPMPSDIMREGGEAAIKRALAWFVDEDRNVLEPGLEPGRRHAAFNITVLGMLLGTPLEPDLSDHILLLEEVSEHMYATDRAMFHLTASDNIRQAAGIRLGRVRDVLPNDPDFGEEAEEVVRRWCEDHAKIPYLGRADIGHDSANKVVPFGLWQPS